MLAGCHRENACVDEAFPRHEVKNPLHFLNASDADKAPDNDVGNALLRGESFFAVCVPQCEDEVSQSQVHGGVPRILWELVELIQLHHVWPHAQRFPTLVGLVERLEVPVHA